MVYGRRLFWALAFGIAAGAICGALSVKGMDADMRVMVFLSTLLNRAFIGFVIGLSAWRIGWALHGILIGLIGSLPMSVPLIINEQAGFIVFLMFTVAGVVWGFLIELLTTVVFKAPMKTGQA